MGDTTTAMLATPMPTATTDTTARGLLRPRPSPRLMPTPTCCTEATTDTPARGLLMPSPRPSPTTTADTTVATPVPTTVDTDTEPTGDKCCPATPGPSLSNCPLLLNLLFLP